MWDLPSQDESTTRLRQKSRWMMRKTYKRKFQNTNPAILRLHSIPIAKFDPTRSGRCRLVMRSRPRAPSLHRRTHSIWAGLQEIISGIRRQACLSLTVTC